MKQQNQNQEQIEVKFTISNAAVDVYTRNNGHFTIKETARQLGIEPREIFNYFPDKKTILQFYYASLIYRYEVMVEDIEGFNSYTISEKLSSFIFSSFDMLSEKQFFVEQTFKSLILNSTSTTKFERETQRLFSEFLYDDDRISASAVLMLNPFFYSFLRGQYLRLIRYRLNDHSPDKEQTMELTDKLTGLLEELLYNTVVDKTVDLCKFTAANRKGKITNLPIIDKFFSNIEIR